MSQGAYKNPPLLNLSPLFNLSRPHKTRQFWFPQRTPIVLRGKHLLSKNVMRSVARFRIRGHGLKCETVLYGRSLDRSARVCFLCENGDIQDEKQVISSCMGTEQLRHQFNHLFDNISDGDIKGFDFQHNRLINSLVQLSIFFPIFVGTCRLSSHARLEAFVIQT